MVVLLEDENRGKHELHLQPSKPLRRLAQFEKQLPPLLQMLMVTVGISELRLQLGELAALQPKQLSLYEVSREQRSLRGALKAWGRRFHETVYQLSLTDVPRHFPPALQYESEAISA